MLECNTLLKNRIKTVINMDNFDKDVRHEVLEPYDKGKFQAVKKLVH
jgi:hypothetical protein